MRVEHGEKSQQQGKTKSFDAELKKAQAKPATAKSVAAKPAPPVKSPAHAAAPKAQAIRAEQQHTVAALGRAKVAAEKFDSKLQDRRTHAEVHKPELKRFAEKIAKLLVDEPQSGVKAAHEQPVAPVQPVLVAQQPSNQPGPSATPVNPTARTEALAAKIEQLLERVEVLAKAEGPAISLALNEGRAAKIEVVRTGKGEVALRLEARTGSERRALASQVAAIRAVLAERGLKVREVTVA